jgi:hypothetical protein
LEPCRRIAGDFPQQLEPCRRIAGDFPQQLEPCHRIAGLTRRNEIEVRLGLKALSEIDRDCSEISGCNQW